MTGLFDSLGVNVEDLPETGFTNPKDGFYNFEITEVTKRQGTKKDPNVTKLTIEYDLDEDGKATEWFTLAQNGEVTEKVLESLRFLRDRLVSLGVDPSTFDEDSEDLIGIRGSLKLVTGKNGFQNVRNVEVDNDGAEEPEEDTEAQDAAIKRKVAANRAAREAEAKPAVKRTVARKPAPKKDADEDDENPFEGE